MIKLLKSAERGHANHGWLDSYHSFSFANYFDPQWMGFRDLRVINEDEIAAAKGFGEHGHADMEIVTYVTAGELEHRDSMGTGSVLRPGDVQRMTAGTGVTHSEFNHSKTHGLKLLQIWILPQKRGIKPGYEEKHFSPLTKRNQLRLIASNDGREGSLMINQDTSIFASLLDEGKVITHGLKPGRGAWVQMIAGDATVNHSRLQKGDGAAIENENQIEIRADQSAEFLLFDLR